MAGDALPLAHVEYPGIGEAADMIVWLALVRTSGVINAGDHSGITEEVHFDVLNVGQGGLEEWIFDVGKKFLFITDLAVIFGIHEAAGNKLIESGRIAMDLRFIPEMLQDDEFAFARIGLLGGHYDGAQGKQKTAADVTSH